MNKWLSATLVLLLALAACSERHDNYARFEDIPPQGWPYGLTIDFNTPGVDSVQAHTIEVSVRHTSSYPFSNLWLEVKVKEGNKFNIDTLEMLLSDSYGRWIGKGFGPTYQMTAPLPDRYFITDSTQVFIRHIMRADTVRGIEQVGITLSPAKQN